MPLKYRSHNNGSTSNESTPVPKPNITSSIPSELQSTRRNAVSVINFGKALVHRTSISTFSLKCLSFFA